MSDTHLTAQILRDLYHYNPETGIFTRRIRRGGYLAGGMAGSHKKKGYLSIAYLGKEYPAHRVAWLYVYGKWPNGFIDHKNGIKSDNRIENLREANSKLNNENRRTASTKSRTGLLGAYPFKNRFVAFIGTNGKNKNLGYFDTAEEAHEAYLKAKRKIHEGCTI